MLTGRWLCLGILFFNLAACTEGGHHNSSQVANASVSLVGDSSRSLGQVFTEPPKNIGNGDGFAPQPFIDGEGHAAVMVVAHHSRGLNIGALDLVTTSRITPLVLGGSELTANGFGYVQDPLTKRIYVPTDTNGQFTYTASFGFTGSDIFTYSVSDGNGGTIATETIAFTDFPLPELKLYVTNNTILLPSEY